VPSGAARAPRGTSSCRSSLVGAGDSLRSARARRKALERVGEPIVEPALALERGELVVAADMAPVDENLRNGAKAARALDHFVALGGVEADVDLDIVETLGPKQILRRPAISAKLRAVDENFRHESSSRK